MNFDKIRFIKSGKHISIFNDKMEKIHFIEDLCTIYGNERNDNVNYVNWTIDDSLKSTLENVENEFCTFMKSEFEINDSWTWKYSVRTLSYQNVIRTTNSKNKNVNKNEMYTVKVILDSVWLNKQTKTFGILWTFNL